MLGIFDRQKHPTNHTPYILHNSVVQTYYNGTKVSVKSFYYTEEAEHGNGRTHDLMDDCDKVN